MRLRGKQGFCFQFHVHVLPMFSHLMPDETRLQTIKQRALQCARDIELPSGLNCILVDCRNGGTLHYLHYSVHDSIRLKKKQRSKSCVENVVVSRRAFRHYGMVL